MHARGNAKLSTHCECQWMHACTPLHKHSHRHTVTQTPIHLILAYTRARARNIQTLTAELYSKPHTRRNTHFCTQPRAHAAMQSHILVHTCANTHARMCAYAHVRLCTNVRARMLAHIHAHTPSRLHARTHAHTLAHAKGWKLGLPSGSGSPPSSAMAIQMTSLPMPVSQPGSPSGPVSRHVETCTNVLCMYTHVCKHVRTHARTHACTHTRTHARTYAGAPSQSEYTAAF